MNVMLPTIVIQPGREGPINRNHPWIFSGSILETKGTPKEGDVVLVKDKKDTVLGVGLFGEGSLAVKIIGFQESNIETVIQRNLQLAVDLRKTLGFPNAETNMFRLVNGEGDFIPGLIIDLYNDSVVIQCHHVGIWNLKELIAKNIKSTLSKTLKIELDTIYCTFEGKFHQNSSLKDFNPEPVWLLGEKSKTIGLENKINFSVDWTAGQKTGFFLDQRENRELVKKLSCGKKVLNMCCYTGGFSISALAGEATLVHSVDVSEKAIDKLKENINLNFKDSVAHSTTTKDVFSFLENHTDEYDIVILDPPAFAKERGANRNALSGYKRLQKLGISKVKPGGLLLSFSCTQVISKSEFLQCLYEAVLESNRKSVNVLKELGAAPCHPTSIFHPEGRYLKGLLVSC